MSGQWTIRYDEQGEPVEVIDTSDGIILSVMESDPKCAPDISSSDLLAIIRQARADRDAQIRAAIEEERAEWCECWQAEMALDRLLARMTGGKT